MAALNSSVFPTMLMRPEPSILDMDVERFERILIHGALSRSCRRAITDINFGRRHVFHARKTRYGQRGSDDFPVAGYSAEGSGLRPMRARMLSRRCMRVYHHREAAPRKLDFFIHHLRNDSCADSLPDRLPESSIGSNAAGRSPSFCGRCGQTHARERRRNLPSRRNGHGHHRQPGRG